MKGNRREVFFGQKLSPHIKKLSRRSRPIARQFLLQNESADDDSFDIDPFGELSRASKVKGLKQRFPDRVLVMTSETCFANCRYCTRRGILGKTPIVETSSDLQKCVDYVKSRKRVRDVLLSGGDVLTLPDEKVARFVDAFAILPQVDVVRICTRALSTNPERITDRLVKMLSKSRKVWVNTQFNCADELTPESVKAASMLVDSGIPVSCQTVLLKGVNDTPSKMLSLLKALSSARIRPYYVFMCDPVAGIDKFRVPLEKARKIEKYCAENIGGLSMPRFVQDLPGAKRKVPI